MGISIAVNTQKQSATGLTVVTVITSIISILPISYYFIRIIIELVKSVNPEPYSREMVTFLVIIFICMILIFILTSAKARFYSIFK